MLNEIIDYRMPTQIIFKDGCLNMIDKFIKERKTILITSKGFEKKGLIDKIKSLSSHIVATCSSIPSHPTFEDLEPIYNEIYKEDFELILAIGGGSVIDSAKFFSLYNNTKKAQFVEDFIKGKAEKKDYKIKPIISMPTTAGTGSELTAWATIWDKKEKKKYSLHSEELFSEVALYDAILTLSLPKDITIQTALDTLSHSLESIWNKNANEITVSYAIKSAKLVVKHLPLLVKDLKNLEHRREILKACMYSGLAFSNTQTALAHAMSYYITLHKNIPHGIACGFTLPMLIDNIINKYSFIDSAIVDIFGELSSNPLRELFKNLEIKTNFEDYGICLNELETLKNSLKSTTRANNSLVKLHK